MSEENFFFFFNNDEKINSNSNSKETDQYHIDEWYWMFDDVKKPQ